MGNPPSKSVEDKVRIVLAVLRGEPSPQRRARRSQHYRRGASARF